MEECIVGVFFFFFTLNYGEIRINNRAADPQNGKTAELGETGPLYIVFLTPVQ